MLPLCDNSKSKTFQCILVDLSRQRQGFIWVHYRLEVHFVFWAFDKCWGVYIINTRIAEVKKKKAKK